MSAETIAIRLRAEAQANFHALVHKDSDPDQERAASFQSGIIYAVDKLLAELAVEHVNDRLDGQKCSMARLWLVISEDRGMGVGVESGHATEEEANGCCVSNCFVTYVDIPIERIDCLAKTNASDQLPPQ